MTLRRGRQHLEVLEFLEFLEILKDKVISVFSPLVSELTAGYDESHNLEHHKCVLANMIGILPSLTLDKKTTYMALVAAFVHDTIDHKYPGAVEKTEVLRLSLAEHIGNDETDRVLMWISRMSFSKQTADTTAVSDEDAGVIDALRDADRIEALGNVGLARCRAYTQSRNPDASTAEIEALVVKHCHEKLLRLLPEGFIVTSAGKALAKEGHDIIVEFVRDYENS